MLNPNLNREAIAEEFAHDGRVRIENLLDEDIAERIRDYCLNNVPYEYLTNLNDKSVVITPDEMKNMDRQQLGEMQQHIMTAATNGVGFFYCGYKMNRARADTGDVSSHVSQGFYAEATPEPGAGFYFVVRTTAEFCNDAGLWSSGGAGEVPARETSLP